MKNKNSLKLWQALIFLTSVLTFFLLWLSSSDQIKTWYVKNILKTNITNDSWVYSSNFWYTDLDLSRFLDAYSVLKKNYYSVEWIKTDKIIDGAIKGMVDSLWDRHSEFLNQEETKWFNEMLSGDFEWIWAFVEQTEIWVLVSRIIKWSPAKEFGVLKDDIIIEANGVDLVGLPLFEAVSHIKWPAWTTVKLKIIRPWEKEILEKEVVRWKIKVPSVESEIYDNNTWYIALNMYGDSSSEEFKQALNSMKDTDWIIIDLRDNGGWYLQSAVEILSEFIENGEVLVSTKYRNNLFNLDYKSLNFNWIYEWKVVVLINENSASASEITAWALKDHKKAIIVWVKSYGKWSVQEPFDMEGWSLLKLTIAKWFTPNGKNIDHEWIDPDIEVQFKKEDYDFYECKSVWVCDESLEEKDFKFYDRQLEVAKETLVNFIKTWDIKETIGFFNQEKENTWL